jgi:hypothetical protein
MCSRCCKQRPEERATADELMAHPFLDTACNAGRLSGEMHLCLACAACPVTGSRYIEALE